jgi:hypothetical protein
MKPITLDKSEVELIKDLLLNNETQTAAKLLKKIDRSLKQIKPRSAKAKGRDFQYQICEDLARTFNIEFNQKDDNCEIHSREMGLNGVDIILRGSMYNLFPFDIECKNCENLSIPEWIRQAKSNTKDERDWLLVIKSKKLDDPVVCLEWDRFLEMWK